MSTSKSIFPTRVTMRAGAVVLAALLVAGCDEAGNFDLESVFTPAADGEQATAGQSGTQEFIEKDVEAPEVFQANEAGLWDGRPSLGGVWVAHPDVDQPERVIIRNQSNGQFVVGALFRREREIPGPRLQISSDAAQAIGVLAGAPVELDVVALRKEKVAVTPPPAPVTVETTEGDAIAAPAEVEATSLDPIEAAGAAIEAAPATKVETEAIAAAASAAPAVESTLPVSSLDKPFVQVGIFSVEKNAERAAQQMRSAGLVPTIRKQETAGQSSYRVLIGPASSSGERRKLLNTVKDVGFSDAYIVTN